MGSPRADAMNGEVLKWARERIGLDASQLADVLSKDGAAVEKWEAGEEFPTFKQLEKLAAALRMPVAVFFFPSPPEVEAPAQEFRMLPEPLSSSEARDTAIAIAEAQARQFSIMELSDGGNPAGSKFLFGGGELLSPGQLRKELGVSLEMQTSWPSAEDGFKAWRQALELRGVVVFKRSFKQKAISGFCLPHRVAPVVVVNNGTTWTRQIFTLFHEVAHLVHRHYGVTRSDLGFLGSLPESESAVEVECNRFASEFLLPHASFDGYAPTFSGEEEWVEQAANFYKVSREVVLRRLVDLGAASRELYEAWVRKWTAGFYARTKPRRKKGESSGNYYNTTAAYLGPTFLRLACSAYLRGKIDLPELAGHLGVRGKSVPGLLERVE